MRLAKVPKFINIDSSFPLLVDYFEKQADILAVYLYGSYGTEFQTPLSDVDIAVLFHSKPDFERLLDIQGHISDICRNDDINVLVLNEAPVMLQFKVIMTGRLLYERERNKLSDFLEHVFKLYGDFAPFYAAFCREYDASLRETYVYDRQDQVERQDGLHRE
ncbi:MAG TPA: nucleotidyltransferase domain-containing protein [Clostridia bacterium]|nr:nucleotidyltransferase domain-containing protein [Clostridia bacterium]